MNKKYLSIDEIVSELEKNIAIKTCEIKKLRKNSILDMRKTLKNAVAEFNTLAEKNFKNKSEFENLEFAYDHIFFALKTTSNRMDAFKDTLL